MAKRSTTDHPMPGFDAEALVGAQRRYLEAWMGASHIMIDAMRTVMQRQAELAQEGMQELLAGTGSIMASRPGAADPADQLGKLTGFYEKAFDGFKELTDVMLKAQAEAVSVLSQGAAAGLDDIKRSAA